MTEYVTVVGKLALTPYTPMVSMTFWDIEGKEHHISVSFETASLLKDQLKDFLGDKNES